MKPFLALLFVAVSFAACSQQSKSFQNIDNKEFSELMNDSNTVILDVRTPEEFEQGHIPHATLINLRDPNFSQELDSLDQSKTYLVYCGTGSRSSKASALLGKKGFKNIYNLENGFNQWNGPKEK